MKRLKDKDVAFSGPTGEPGRQDARSELARSAAPAATRLRRRGIGIAGLWAVVVLAAGLSLAAPAAASTLGDAAGLTPTVESDKADYAPGETVTLTGANWQSGESVHIVVNDDMERAWREIADIIRGSETPPARTTRPS